MHLSVGYATLERQSNIAVSLNGDRKLVYDLACSLDRSLLYDYTVSTSAPQPTPPPL